MYGKMVRSTPQCLFNVLSKFMVGAVIYQSKNNQIEKATKPEHTFIPHKRISFNIAQEKLPQIDVDYGLYYESDLPYL